MAASGTNVERTKVILAGLLVVSLVILILAFFTGGGREKIKQSLDLPPAGAKAAPSGTAATRVVALYFMSDDDDLLHAEEREIPAGPPLEEARAVVEAILAGPTPKSEHDERIRREFRAHVDSLGARLGFEVDSDGTWSSMTGVDIVTRTVERPLTLAAAVHFVTEVASAASASDAHAVLFVVEGQQNADVFKVAIRQRRLHDLMRTTSLASLAEVADLVERGILDHQRAVLLLAPVANIDVGEMLAVLHAGGGEIV